MRCKNSTSWVLLVIAVTITSCTVPKTLDLPLMKKVTTDLGKNEAISPFVMSSLMTQVWLAANGTTRDEMTPVLGVTTPAVSTFLPAYQSAINYIATSSSQLTTAVFNRIYVRSGFSVKQSFSNLLVTYYGASVVSFSSASQAANQINSDVASVTNNRIQNLVSPVVLGNALVVLVSALYFKGDWKYTFNNASPASFLTQSGEKQVNMMELNLTALPYANMGTYDVVSLPYNDTDYCMLLIRPVQRSMAAVTALRNSLDTLDIDSIIQGLINTNIEVRMPRFKIEAAYSLGNAMFQLGIQEIFGLGADFSGLTNTGGLVVSNIVHKVFIEVDEKGTEAAGAGAIVFGITSTLPTPIPLFHADRPFFAVVYNKKQNINMFTAFIGSPPPAVN